MGAVMSGRQKTTYPGVFYREADRIGSKGTERVYYIVFKKDGKVFEEKVGRQYADDMTPARAARIRAERIEGKRASRKEVREQQEAAKRAEAGKWTISRLWDEYKRQNDIKGIAQDESRYKTYLEAPFGKREPSELISLDVDRLRIKLLKDKKPQTVKNTLALLRRIINFGEKKGLCRAPEFTIQMPEKINNMKTEDLVDEEMSTLLAVLNEDPDIQVTNLMKLVLCTGMRRGELFRLEWRDIDYSRGFINIRDPKGGPDQKIPLNASARDILDNHPKTDGSPFVFPGRNGGQRVEIRKAANRIKRNAGLPDDFRPLHGLRHTYASMLASSGQVDLYTLQKLLTHKSPEMTQRYAHLRDEALRKASDLAGCIVQQAMNGKDGKVIPLEKYENANESS
jgi:integrase